MMGFCRVDRDTSAVGKGCDPRTDPGLCSVKNPGSVPGSQCKKGIKEKGKQMGHYYREGGIEGVLLQRRGYY